MGRLSFILAAVLAIACGPAPEAEDPLKYTENARKAYDAALESYFDRDWENAVAEMEEVRRKYAYTRYARLAELRIADAAYHQEEWGESVAGYKSFVSDYPNDPEVPYARYKIVKALFEQSSDNLLLPPLEERDLAHVRDAYITVREFLSDYPSYKHEVELEYIQEVVTGLLARHELYVARFYLADSRFEAAVARVQYALRNFEGSGLEAEGLVLLGELYMKLKERDKAKRLFVRVIKLYPDSPFTIPAKNFLDELERKP